MLRLKEHGFPEADMGLLMDELILIMMLPIVRLYPALSEGIGTIRLVVLFNPPPFILLIN